MVEVAEAPVTSAEEKTPEETTAATTEAPAVVYGEETQKEEATEPETISFGGSQKNLVVASAMLLASLTAFTMGMTDTFFAEATAWTFAIWGALLLFSNLLDLYQTYEVREDSLYIHNAIRFWSLNKTWAWEDINRLDVLVDRQDSRIEDVMMHVYHDVEGELIKEREDREFDPELARLIIERANLQPVDESNPADLHGLPLNRKVIYHWTQSGSLSG
jgi:hypothetical protein